MIETKINWRVYIVMTLISLIAITSIAIWTKLWVLTALPIGFMFGFFLQKGDLCGSSAFSEVIIMKDWKKIEGLWIAIVVSMLGFAFLDIFGLVKLNPKPLLWLSYIVGGIIFGIGIVLAGGCVSGCLFKTGMGNLNSMAALVAIPIGIGLVEYGPLASFHKYLKSFEIKASDGGQVTLSSLTGISFWLLALVFGVITFVVFFIKFHRKDKKSGDSTPEKFWVEKLCTWHWKAWQAGLAIGFLAILAYLSSAASGRNYPLGVTHGVFHVQLLTIDHNFKHVWKPKFPKAQSTMPASPSRKSSSQVPKSPKPESKKIVWWLVGLVTTMILGSWVSSKLSGDAKLLPKPPEQIFIAFFGGILVGGGASLAKGCVMGNIVSGWALMSVGTFLFGVVAIITNWVTTYFYLMGGSLRKS